MQQKWYSDSKDIEKDKKKKREKSTGETVNVSVMLDTTLSFMESQPSWSCSPRNEPSGILAPLHE